MSHEFVPVRHLLKKPYRFTPGFLGTLLHTGIELGDARVLRPDKDHVRAFSCVKKSKAIAGMLIRRSDDEKSPFEAGIIFRDGRDIHQIVGYAVVNRNVKVVEHGTRLPENRLIGPQVDTCSVILYHNLPDDVRVANSEIISQLGLRNPVTIEPETTDVDIRKALLDIYGPGTTGPFMQNTKGFPLLSTAYGVTL